ncbi:MAG: glycosyltransferase [Patescibacteria group bacterium]
MRVLMISGDKNFTREGTSAYERFMLQASEVEKLELIVWPQQFFKPFFVRGQFDVVTSQDPFWRGLAALLAAARTGAKLNIQVHADLHAQSKIKQLLARFVLRRADSVRVVSKRLEARAAEITGAPIYVLPVFIDIEQFSHIQKETGKSTANILWIGRFEEEKDPLASLEVLRVVREAGIDARLIMLGSGSLKESIRAKAVHLGVSSHVEFAGWQDPLAYLKKADVVLCTSRAESYGASIIEALASGIATVAPDVGIAREAGAIIAPREQLAQKTIEVLMQHTKGHLALSLPNAQEWAAKWKQSLTI